MRQQRLKHPKAARPRARAKKTSPGTQVIYGVHAVTAAVQNPARKVIKLSASENAAHRFGDILRPFSETLKIVKAAELDRMVGADAVHQGLVLHASPLPEPTLDHILQQNPDRWLFVVLDQITDPHNVGAILRSCAAFDVTAVIIPARNSVEYSGVLAKAASGAIEHVPLIRVTNLARALKTLKASSVFVVGFDSELSQDFETIRDLRNIALVFGAEGKGMRRLTRENCDHLVRLNTTGAIKSLNVSNACAVALYSLSIR